MTRAEAARQAGLTARRDEMAVRCYLSAGDVARRWGVSLDTVYESGLPCFRPGGRVRRYHPNDIERFEKEHSVCGST